MIYKEFLAQKAIPKNYCMRFFRVNYCKISHQVNTLLCTFVHGVGLIKKQSIHALAFSQVNMDGLYDF